MNVSRLGWEMDRARRAAGLSQSAVAARMGTTQSAVSRLESGRIDPSVEFIDRFARAIGRPITLTFGDERRASRGEIKSRLRKVLGDFEFDPWARDPAPAEQRSLEADGLTREHFEGLD